MNGFGLARLPSTIIFGDGQRSVLPRATLAFGNRAFLCVDPYLQASAEWFAPLLSAMEDAGIATAIFSDIAPELPMACLDSALAQARSFAPTVLVGIGGGSCLDLAKLLALLLAHDGAVQDYYGELNVPGPTLPVIALPTTAGTGSEVTPVAVIEDPERATKVGLSSPHLIPRVAICDPEVTWSCPPTLTAASGADAMTHAIEAFTAARRPFGADLVFDHVFVGKNVMSDQFALSAIGLLGRSLAKAVADGSDRAARSDIMQAALLAGMAFGTAGTAAAHALQYPVGAITHTAHGVGVAVLLPYVMQYNRSCCTTEYAAIARALGQTDGTEPELADRAITAVADLFARIGIPSDLAAMGLHEDQIGWAAQQGFSAKRLVHNNPRTLSEAALATILRASYRGERRSLEKD